MYQSDLVAEVPPAFTQLSQHEYILFSPSLAGAIETGPRETLEARTAVGSITGLVHAAGRAQEAAGLALSWRAYNVGASVAMYNFATARFGYLDGFNVKPQSGQEGLNFHAEQIAVAKGRLHGLNRVLGIAVYADPLNDDANPYGTDTLRPCPRCIDMFDGAPEVDDRTLVLGSNPDFTKCEIYTVGSLKKSRIESGQMDHEKLVDETFSLHNDADLECYDRNIVPVLARKVFELYQCTT